MSRRVRRRQRKQPHILQVFLIIVLVLLTVCVLVKAFFLKAPEQKAAELPAQSAASDTDSQQSPEEQAAQEALRSHLERKGGFYTILLSGLDDDNGGSDTNILMAVDTVNGYVYGASIPRDSKAIIGGKAHKINYAYNKGGTALLASTVSEQLGIPVDYTVCVNLQGFTALVDAIGGVDFEVPINMDYDDPIQGLSIHFKKGMQHLSGADALRVVRFRHNNDGTGYGSEDLGRMQTQQKFLKAVAKKMLSFENLISNPRKYAEIFGQYVDTDLSVTDLAWFGMQVLGMGVDKIDFSTLPNEWKYPYIYLDPDETLALVNTYLNPYVEDRTAEDLNLPG
ncbi:MAG: LytR family transcriptional regulator [Clostridiales bacterium]|nr:LytR family transcriptional regulator [Clostridiales bacterium]